MQYAKLRLFFGPILLNKNSFNDFFSYKSQTPTNNQKVRVLIILNRRLIWGLGKKPLAAGS